MDAKRQRFGKIDAARCRGAVGFRYNYRNDMKDGDRFELAASQIIGKRLTYAEVTGKVGEIPATT